MKTIAFFNNKGGVGKTTLVCNLAHYLSAREGQRVLVIDLDPQCNTTQLMLPPEACAELYWPENGEYLGTASHDSISTVYDAVQPLEEGEASVAAVRPMAADSNRFGVSILPGHPRMSVFEDLLGQWFRDAVAGEIAGLRKTLWLSGVVARHEADFDFVLVDLGPSLGALNRSVLAAVDHFATPMGADIFSVVALRNIADWMAHWLRLYTQGVDLCETNNAGAVDKFSVPRHLAVSKGFVGYTVQQYSTVSIRGERRATLAYESIMERVPQQVEAHLAALASSGLELEALKLGDIPNLRSLIPLAQNANAPLAALTAKDGLTGGQYSQQRNYAELIDRVGERLYRNLSV